MKKVILISVSIFLSLFFVSRADASIIGQVSDNYATSGYGETNWYYVMGNEASVSTNTLQYFQVSLNYASSNTGQPTGTVYSFTCADWDGTASDFTTGLSMTTLGTLLSSDQVLLNTKKFYNFVSDSPITLPNGKCFAILINTQSTNTYVYGSNYASVNGFFLGNTSLNNLLLVNGAGPPYESVIEVGYFKACSDLLNCLNISQDLIAIPTPDQNLRCDLETGGGWGSVSVKYVACFLFVPSLGADYLNDQFTDLTGYFPFNLITDFASSVSAYADNYTTSSQSLTFDFTGPVDIDVSITSSTLAVGNFGSIYSTIRDYLDLLIWAMLGLSIIAVVFKK